MSKLEIKGCLMSMGGDLPRLTIQCADGTLVELSNVDPALLAGMPMLLYRRVRLVVEAEDQPAPAAATEDAEFAAYLERWKDAPEWAQWLSQDRDGRCDFWKVRPALFSDYEWLATHGEPTHLNRQTADNLLGSVRCEPRPEVRP